jgi:hypothetical protein
LLAALKTCTYPGEPQKHARITQTMDENRWAVSAWDAAELAVAAVARAAETA